MTDVRRWLLAFVRPDRAFEGWGPSFRLAAAAVLVLALVNAVGVAMSAGAVETAVSGTVMIDNPDRPDDAFCERYTEGGVFNDSPNAEAYAADCVNEPRQIEERLAPVAGNAATGMAFSAFVITIVGWLLVAAVFALFVRSEDRGGFVELLAVAGWGTIPAALRYAARPVFVGRTVGSWDYPGAIDPLQSAARAFVAGDGSTLFATVVVATLAWQAAIYAYGVAALTDASFGRTATVAGVLGFVLATLFVAGVALPPGETAVTGVALLVFGLPGVAAPSSLARFREQLDAIGSTTRMRDVEPAGWNVRLIRAIGTAMLAGAFWILGGPLFV